VTENREPIIYGKGSEPKSFQVTSADVDPDTRQIVCEWLKANGVDPRLVVLAPITLEFRPRSAGSETSCSGISRAPWWIAFTQQFVNEDGRPEANALTNALTSFERTVPLRQDPPKGLVSEWKASK
jgi:hypothetical protein